jgi:CHAT domain-containing protein
MNIHFYFLAFICLFVSPVFAQKNCTPNEANRLLYKAQNMLKGEEWLTTFDTAFASIDCLQNCPPESISEIWLQAWTDLMWLEVPHRKKCAESLFALSEKMPESNSLKINILQMAVHFSVGQPKNDWGRKLFQTTDILRKKIAPNDLRLAAWQLLLDIELINQNKKGTTIHEALFDSMQLVLDKNLLVNEQLNGQIALIHSYVIYNQKRYSEVNVWAEKAAAIFQKTGTLKHFYDAQIFVAAQYRAMGKPEEAVLVRQKTIDWLRNAAPYFQKKMLPEALNSQGIDLKNSGRYTEAQHCYEEALRLMHRDKDSMKKEADLETNLGVIFQRKGQFEASESHLKKGTELVVKLYGADHEESAKRYGNLGILYQVEHKYELSKQFLQKAIPIFEKSGSNPFFIFGPYITLINIADSENDTLTMRHWLTEIEKNFEKNPKDVTPQLWLNYATMLGAYLINTNQLAAAIERCSYYLDKYPPFDNDLTNREWVELRSQLANAKTLNGDLEGAIAIFTQNLKANYFKVGNKLQYRNRGIFQGSVLQLASVWLDYFDKNKTKFALDSAKYYHNLALLSLNRKALTENMEVFDSDDRNFDSYHIGLALQNCLRLYRFGDGSKWLKEAFDLTEASNLEHFRTYLSSHPGIAFNGVSMDELGEETDLRLAISAEEQAEFDAFNKAKGDRTAPEYLSHASKLLDLRTRYDLTVQNLAKKHPDLYRLQFSLPLFGADSLQQRFLNKDQCWVQFFHDPIENLMVVQLLRNDTLVSFDFKTDKAFNSALFTIRKAAASARFEGKSEEFVQAAHQVFQVLFGKIAPLLTTEIFISSTDILAGLCFETLLSKIPEQIYRPNTWHFLGQEHALSYATAASLLRLQQTRRPNNPKADKFIGFAPFFTGDTSLLAAAFPDVNTTIRRDLQPLPFSGTEVKMFEKITKGTGFYGEKATKAQFLTLASSAKIIHLATHGQTNKDLGDYSFLAFSEKNLNSQEAILYAHELYNLSLSTDLLVLSACETGLGNYDIGEGINGFVKASICAGSRSLVASLWPVNDKHTRTLMRNFYLELKKGKPKNIALWEAKKQFFEDNKAESAPFFWAGFVLSGDVAPILFNKK